MWFDIAISIFELIPDPERRFKTVGQTWYLIRDLPKMTFLIN
jgi:hypothetical protein